MKLKFRKGIIDKYDSTIKYVAGCVYEFTKERAEEIMKAIPNGVFIVKDEVTEEKVVDEKTTEKKSKAKKK